MGVWCRLVEWSGPVLGTPELMRKRTEESRRLKWLQLPPRKLTAARLVVNEVRRVEWRVGNKPWANHSVTLVRKHQQGYGRLWGRARWKTPDWCQKQRRRFVTSQLLFQLTHLERRDKGYGMKTKWWLTPGPLNAYLKPRKCIFWSADVCKNGRNTWRMRLLDRSATRESDRKTLCVFPMRQQG